MFTLEDLIQYAKTNNLTSQPFETVLDMYEKDMIETIKGWEADAYLATMEAHELT